MNRPKSIEGESTTLIPLSLQERYLLTEAGQQQVAFLAHWVAEIIRVERSQILALPFYPSEVLGVFHHRGEIVPLFFYHASLMRKSDPSFRPLVMKETLQVIRLNQAAENLSGVGLVVEQVVGNITAEEVASQPTIRRFQFDDIPKRDWQPEQRWFNASK